MKAVNKIICAGALSLLTSASFAATFDILDGVVTNATGALAALVAPGTPFSGDMDWSDDALNNGLVRLGGFCFTPDASSAPPSSPACIALQEPGVSLSAVPMLPTGATSYNPAFSAGGIPAGATFQQAGTSFNTQTGGVIELTTFSPSFSVLIDITLTLNADGTGSMAASSSLGTAEGNLTWEPVIVPVPAALWLFGSSLIGLVGIKRRQSS